MMIQKIIRNILKKQQNKIFELEYLNIKVNILNLNLNKFIKTILNLNLYNKQKMEYKILLGLNLLIIYEMMDLINDGITSHKF